MEDLVTMAKNESSKQQTSYPENKIVVFRGESAKFPLIAQMMTSRGIRSFFGRKQFQPEKDPQQGSSGGNA